MIDIFEEPPLSDEQEEYLRERYEIKEMINKYKIFVSKVKDVLAEDGDALARLDEIRFYVNELEDELWS